MAENPMNKLMMPKSKKGVAVQAPKKGSDDPLGLDLKDESEDDYDMSDDEGVDDLFGDDGESKLDFDPDMKIGDASLEDLRTALKAKEREAEEPEEDDYSDTVDEEDADM